MHRQVLGEILNESRQRSPCEGINRLFELERPTPPPGSTATSSIRSSSTGLHAIQPCRKLHANQDEQLAPVDPVSGEPSALRIYNVFYPLDCWAIAGIKPLCGMQLRRQCWVALAG